MKDIRVTDKKDLGELQEIKKLEQKKNPYAKITNAGIVHILIKIYWEFKKLTKGKVAK